jgi:peptide/nickel transport system permease protein
MGKYILRRALHGVLVLFGVSVIVFLLMHLSGDPAAVLLPLDTHPEQIAEFRHAMGFDRPLPVQYLYFLSRAARGDFGYSYHYKAPALPIVLERMPATIKLAACALAISLLVSIPAGILSALKKGSLFDMLVRAFVLLGQAAPGFWLAIVLIMAFSIQLRWLPVSGSEGWKSLVLPAFTAAAFSMATITRLLRSSLLETLCENYIQTAHGKGLPRRTVITRHALKNAALPVVTVVGLQMGWLLGGAVVAEVVFAYAGMGRLAITAISYRDLPIIQAFVFVTATIIVVINLGVDIAYTLLDPRIVLND